MAPTIYTQRQICNEVLRQANVWLADQLSAAAMAETGGAAVQSSVINEQGNRENSWGPLQINLNAWPQYSVDYVMSLEGAVAAAIQVYNAQGMRAWSVTHEQYYGTSRSYWQYLGRIVTMDWIAPTLNRKNNCGFTCYPGHYADDLNANWEPFWAMRDGTVVTVVHSLSGRTGRYIEILHPGGAKTRYMHLSRIEVAVGQKVQQGQRCGVTGASGYGSETGYGSHLHVAMHFPTYGAAVDQTGWKAPAQSAADGWWAVPPMWVVDNQPASSPGEEDDMFSPDDRRVLQGMGLIAHNIYLHLQNVTPHITNTDQKMNLIFGPIDNKWMLMIMLANQDAWRHAATALPAEAEDLKNAYHAAANAMEVHIQAQRNAIAAEGG